MRVVDELVVMDDGSDDGTAQVASAAGADVVAGGEVLPEYGTEHGKGQAMWRAVHVSTGDLLVFCDADIREFDPGFVLGPLGPLLTRDDVTFVKGYYQRPLDGRPGEGGRVTELMARPLISVFFPHLANLSQPLAGEFARPAGGAGGDSLRRRVRRGPGPAHRCHRAVRGRRTRRNATWGNGSIATVRCPSSVGSPWPSCSWPWSGPVWRRERHASGGHPSVRPDRRAVPSPSSSDPR